VEREDGAQPVFMWDVSDEVFVPAAEPPHTGGSKRGGTSPGHTRYEAQPACRQHVTDYRIDGSILAVEFLKKIPETLDMYSKLSLKSLLQPLHIGYKKGTGGLHHCRSGTGAGRVISE